MDGRYTVFRKYGVGRQGDGACIVAKTALKCCEIALLSSTSELVAVDLITELNSRLRIICVYFSPTGDSSELLTRMSSLCCSLDELSQVDFPVVLTGDLNQPSIHWHPMTLPTTDSTKESIFVTFCIENGFEQLVIDPTRGANILDLVLSNTEDTVTDVKVIPAPVISDHMAIRFNLAIRKSNSSQPERLNYLKADFVGMSTILAATDWRRFFAQCECVDSQYQSLVNLLTYLIESFAPVFSTRSTPIDAFIERAVLTMENSANLSQARKLSKQLAKASARKRRFEEQRLDIRDAKGFFRYANKRLNLQSGVAPLVLDEGTAVEDADKADVLLQYFKSVYIESGTASDPNSFSVAQLRDIQFSDEIVYGKLKGVKKKCSLTPDCLPPVIFHELADVLAAPLSTIFTRSFEDGVVPSLFRESIVTPVFKKGSRNLPSNYRPVAQISIPCIIMEKIVVDEINKFLSTQDLLDPHQHGFTKRRSTSTQLLEVSRDWVLARNRRLPLHIIYFDFSRAFDRVDFDILLSKMSLLGIGPRVVAWCRAYLQDRTFRVKVGDTLSAEGKCTSGVPQGSCLGPLLYSIFVQDLGRSLAALNVTYKMYADDLKIYTTIHDDNDRMELQKATNSVSTWSIANKMEISLPKCAMLKTIPDDTVYYLEGCPITEVETYKDLGVSFDPHLKFRHHVVDVAKTASRMCNLILRAFIIDDTEMYMRLYKSIVVPKWTYCSHVWAPFYRKDIELLQRVQDKFVKRVARCCNLPRSFIVLPSVEEYKRRNDLGILKKLIKANQLTQYFTVRPNSLRSGISITGPEIACIDVVNNSFSWRIERLTREREDFRRLVTPPFQ